MVRNKTILLVLLILCICLISSLFIGCGPREPMNTGGIIVCGVNFPCGAEDGVCPEDFNATCHVKDIDCIE